MQIIGFAKIYLRFFGCKATKLTFFHHKKQLSTRRELQVFNFFSLNLQNRPRKCQKKERSAKTERS